MDKIFHLKRMDFRYWIDELPDLHTKNEKEFKAELPACSSVKMAEIEGAAELFLHKDASCYGLLGFKFIPDRESSRLKISVRYHEGNKEHYFSEIRASGSQKHIYKGLEHQYLSAVTDSIAAFCQKNKLSGGSLYMHTAANCEVGSSPLLFESLTELLLSVMYDISIARAEKE